MDTDERLETIRRRIQTAMDPAELIVEDEGHHHVGHEGATDGRGHFRVFVIAECFEGLPQVHRHRMVYKALGEMMITDIHALAIDAYSPDEI
jgi:BolA protein